MFEDLKKYKWHILFWSFIVIEIWVIIGYGIYTMMDSNDSFLFSFILLDINLFIFLITYIFKTNDIVKSDSFYKNNKRFVNELVVTFFVSFIHFTMFLAGFIFVPYALTLSVLLLMFMFLNRK